MSKGGESLGSDGCWVDRYALWVDGVSEVRDGVRESVDDVSKGREWFCVRNEWVRWRLTGASGSSGSRNGFTFRRGLVGIRGNNDLGNGVSRSPVFAVENMAGLADLLNVSAEVITERVGLQLRLPYNPLAKVELALIILSPIPGHTHPVNGLHRVVYH